MDDGSESGEYVALEEELTPGKTCGVEVGPYKVLVCNVDGELFAVENFCTHAKVSLSFAELRGDQIECPVHGARFDVRTGAVLCLPARRGLRRFDVRKAEGGVIVSLDLV
jgi:3-phenylpropionate/trans-cinnamate dioxygenase ferredoxin subunit